MVIQANLGKIKMAGLETSIKQDAYLVVFQNHLNIGKIYGDLWTNCITNRNNILNEQKSLQRKFLLFK